LSMNRASDSGTQLFLSTLWEDVNTALDSVRDNDTQYNRRALLRVFFSAVEGETHHLKQLILERVDANPALHSTSELAILREEAYQLDRRGRVVVKPKFLPTSDNLRFALKLFVRETLPDFDLAADQLGWEAFTSSLRVRHRVTHPKSNLDLQITDHELHQAKRAYVWFERTVMATIIQSHLVLYKQFHELAKLTEALIGYDRSAGLGEVIPEAELRRVYEAIKKWGG